MTYRHGDRLVIACAGQGADSVCSGRKSSSDCDVEASIAVPGVIDTFEKHECAWVRWSSRIKAVAQRLDGDMGMTNNLAPLQGLRCCIIGYVGVGKGTGD